MNALWRNRRWIKPSNALLALGLVLVLSGARGVWASASDPLGDLAGFGPAADPPSETSRIFLPPTLRPAPTATPFDDIRPLPGAEDAASPQIESAPQWRVQLDPGGYAPERISIPSIQLQAPVAVSPAYQVTLRRQKYVEWAPPDEFAAGWQETSARLGLPGNTVLNGHNNLYGDVFGQLEKVQVGDEIQVISQAVTFHYRVTNRMILRELHQELAIRADNAQWILPSQDERLTLVTCWPASGNSHRLIVVASPVGVSFAGLPAATALK